MFLLPVPKDGTFTTLLDYIKNFLADLFGGSLPYILMVMIVVSAIMSVYDYICKPDWIRKNHYLKKAFSTTLFYLVSKVIGAVVVVLVVLNIGPEFITSVDTGATMVDLCCTLFCIVIGFSFSCPSLPIVVLWNF